MKLKNVINDKGCFLGKTKGVDMEIACADTPKVFGKGKNGVKKI